MLKIIPAIDLINGKCVRLQQGDYSRQTTYNESPVEVAKKWQHLGASMIHIVDLDGAKTGQTINLKTIAKICSSVTCACELGGGIRTISDVKKALEAGVSRVVFGTALAKNPQFSSSLLSHFQSDYIVAGLDARNGKIAIEGWQVGSDITPVNLAKSLFNLGVRHFIYTDISTDGMFSGPNLQGTSALCDAVPEAQVTASGGVGSIKHVKDLIGLEKENLDGVIVGKALYDGRINYKDLAATVTSYLI